MKDSDLNYARNNFCDFIENDVEFCRNSTDVFCFIPERIVLTHIIVLAIRNNMLYEFGSVGWQNKNNII